MDEIRGREPSRERWRVSFLFLVCLTCLSGRPSARLRWNTYELLHFYTATKEPLTTKR